MRTEKRGRYYYAFWTELGRTRKRSTRCETKAAAERVAARWELERADPTYAAANATTLEQEVGAFLVTSKRRMRPATLSMHTQKAGHLLRLRAARVPVEVVP